MRTYEPTGHVKRALEFITENGAQYNGPLADHLGVTPPSQVTNILDYGVKMGVLAFESRVIDGKNVKLWFLGNGVPIPKKKDEPLHAVVIAQVHEQLQDHTAIDDPEPDNRPRAQAATCTESQTGAEFCVTSTGRLMLDVAAGTLALTAKETAALIAYLDKARNIEIVTS